MSYRLKLLLFVLCALAVLFGLNTAYSALNTLSRLDVVEAQRDEWQRPVDVLQALSVQPGDAVADVGCGSGYFSLKLSRAAGKNGRVYAEDIRTLPLVFLWFRKIQKSAGNITLVRGNPLDPHLPMTLSAVLIANTYHELADSQAMLARVRQSLLSGGRLVVVDRAPDPGGAQGRTFAEHEISAERVESELHRANFEIVTRQDRFIEKDPDNESWWMIVARKP